MFDGREGRMKLWFDGREVGMKPWCLLGEVRMKPWCLMGGRCEWNPGVSWEGGANKILVFDGREGRMKEEDAKICSVGEWFATDSRFLIDFVFFVITFVRSNSSIWCQSLPFCVSLYILSVRCAWRLQPPPLGSRSLGAPMCSKKFPRNCETSFFWKSKRNAEKVFKKLFVTTDRLLRFSPLVDYPLVHSSIVDRHHCGRNLSWNCSHHCGRNLSWNCSFRKWKNCSYRGLRYM